MKLPIKLDPGILTAFDALGETIFSAPLSPIASKFYDNLHAQRAQEMRRVIACVNFCEHLSTEGMERMGQMPLLTALQLSLIDLDKLPGRGPMGLVRNLEK